MKTSAESPGGSELERANEDNAFKEESEASVELVPVSPASTLATYRGITLLEYFWDAGFIL